MYYTNYYPYNYYAMGGYLGGFYPYQYNSYSPVNRVPAYNIGSTGYVPLNVQTGYRGQ